MDTVSWYNCRDDRFRRREDEDVEEDCSSLSVVVVVDDTPSILVDAPIPIIATSGRNFILFATYTTMCAVDQYNISIMGVVAA